MTASLPMADPGTKPSIGRRVAAGILTFLSRVLPRRAYDHLYLVAFAEYKAWLRRRYRARVLAQPDADREKVEAVYACLEYSLVGASGLEVTYDCVRDVIAKNVPGDLVECGVAQGGSALLMGLVNQKLGDGTRRLWLFDSFEGLPEPTAEDFKDGKTGTHVRPLPKGSCLGTIEDVSSLLFKKNGLPAASVRLVKGWFQDTLPATREEVAKIALLRLDGDWYESTKVCLETLFDQVSLGGYVLVDDYFSCFGCKLATDEFLASRNKSFPIIADGRGGAYFRKST